MTIASRRWIGLAGGILLGLDLLGGGGCVVRKLAANGVADSLSGSGGVFATDDDPQLVREAIPASLKAIEGVLEATPRHVGLLTTACSSFTQYAYGFILQDADELEPKDIEAAGVLRDR